VAAMKLLSTFFIVVFLLTFTTSAQDKKNPLEGTTWELTSGEWVREDTTLTFPNTPSDQAIIIFGKTHYGLVAQDTSRDFSWFVLSEYALGGNSFTTNFKMVTDERAIGTSFTPTFQIEGDQLTIEAKDYTAGVYKMKNYREVWNRTTETHDKKNPLAGTAWELTSLTNVREDTTFTFPETPYDKYIGIFGQTFWIFVHQDTSRDVNDGFSYTYNIDADNINLVPKIHPLYDIIDKPYSLKFKTEGDQFITHFTDLQFAGDLWKSGHHVWKRID
jgi:predicted secreted protein